MLSLMPGVDRLTRQFWKVTGRRVDLDDAHGWLSAPMHDGSVVGDTWLRAAARAHGGSLAEDVDGAGLLADMSSLDGPHFRVADLHPDIRDFYEHTSGWRLEVWTQWNPFFQPGGGLELRSPRGRFGQDGAYVVVEAGGTHAARVPIHETFRVYVDAEQVVRADHELRLRSATALRMHYKLTRDA